jgi:hypothetical protein
MDYINFTNSEAFTPRELCPRCRKEVGTVNILVPNAGTRPELYGMPLWWRRFKVCRECYHTVILGRESAEPYPDWLLPYVVAETVYTCLGIYITPEHAMREIAYLEELACE